MKKEKVPVLLTRFIDGISKAEGGAAQMVHQHADPRFIPLREKLTRIKEKCIGIAMKATGVEVKHVKH